MEFFVTIIIKPILVLQDGEGRINDTFYPVLHLIEHGLYSWMLFNLARI